MDAATLGITLAIAGLVLMYPVAIIANATTPLVVRGAVNLTRRKLEERVKLLESKLAEDDNWVMTAAELAEYTLTAQLFKFVFTSLHALLTVILVIVLEYQQSTHVFSNEVLYSVVGMLIVFLIANTFAFYTNRRRWIGAYWYHGSKCRAIIQKQIDELKTTLSA